MTRIQPRPPKGFGAGVRPAQLSGKPSQGSIRSQV